MLYDFSLLFIITVVSVYTAIWLADYFDGKK